MNKLKLSKTHIVVLLPGVAHVRLFNNKRKLKHCHEFVKNKQMSDAWGARINAYSKLTPLLVFEVISPTTRSYNIFPACRQAGVVGEVN